MRNLFVVLLVGFLPPLIGQTTQTLSGVYTIQQASNERFIDAHEIESKDFSLVTRPFQRNDTQKWFVKHITDNMYTIQQKSNNRFVDAHEILSKDFKVVTRTQQNNDTQKWIIKNIDDNIYTIQQKSSGRFWEAYENQDKDFRVVTRKQQNINAQNWIIKYQGELDNNHFANSKSGTYKHLGELAKIQKKYLEKFVYVDEDNSPEDVFSVQEEKSDALYWFVRRYTNELNPSLKNIILKSIEIGREINSNYKNLRAAYIKTIEDAKETKPGEYPLLGHIGGIAVTAQKNELDEKYYPLVEDLRTDWAKALNALESYDKSLIAFTINPHVCSPVIGVDEIQDLGFKAETDGLDKVAIPIFAINSPVNVNITHNKSWENVLKIQAPEGTVLKIELKGKTGLVGAHLFNTFSLTRRSSARTVGPNISKTFETFLGNGTFRYLILRHLELPELNSISKSSSVEIKVSPVIKDMADTDNLDIMEWNIHFTQTGEPVISQPAGEMGADLTAINDVLKDKVFKGSLFSHQKYIGITPYILKIKSIKNNKVKAEIENVRERSKVQLSGTIQGKLIKLKYKKFLSKSEKSYSFIIHQNPDKIILEGHFTYKDWQKYSENYRISTGFMLYKTKL